jgi:hypothetical protein
MGAAKKNKGREKSRRSAQVAPRDLIDFYQRWSDFRPMAETLASHSGLSLTERQTVHWLLQLADRVSEHDLKPLKRK